MITLRDNILTFVRKCNDKNLYATLGSIVEYANHPHRNSVEVAVCWLRKNHFLGAKGETNHFQYYITPKGLKRLKQLDNEEELSKLTLGLRQLGGM